jgi:hypothetical protein
MDILYKTVHGSRLYGMSHAGSDWDYYTVVDKVKTNKAKFSTHKIVGETDSVVVDFGTWVDQCKDGVPQALEAMFSNMAVEDRITEFRTSFYVGTQAYDRYLRTIKSFAYSEKDSFKRKRHALRLGINLKYLARYGRFNPTLSPNQVKGITTAAERWDADKVYHAAMAVAHG